MKLNSGRFCRNSRAITAHNKTLISIWIQFIHIWRTISIRALIWRRGKKKKKVCVYRNQMQHFHVGILPLAAPRVFVWSEAPFRRLLLGEEGHWGAKKCFVKCYINTHFVWETLCSCTRSKWEIRLAGNHTVLALISTKREARGRHSNACEV